MRPCNIISFDIFVKESHQIYIQQNVGRFILSNKICIFGKTAQLFVESPLNSFCCLSVCRLFVHYLSNCFLISPVDLFKSKSLCILDTSPPRHLKTNVAKKLFCNISWCCRLKLCLSVGLIQPEQIYTQRTVTVGGV